MKKFKICFISFVSVLILFVYWFYPTIYHSVRAEVIYDVPVVPVEFIHDIPDETPSSVPTLPAIISSTKPTLDFNRKEKTNLNIIKPQSYSSHIKWKVYGENLMITQSRYHKEVAIARNTSLDEPWNFLDNAPKDLQRKMLFGTPPTCHPDKRIIYPKKYEKFLNLLSQYAHSHEAMSKNPDSSRTLVWYCQADIGCGGLSDKLRGMSFALLLAVFSRRRLLLDWKSALESVHFEPNIINWMDSHILSHLHSSQGRNVTTMFIYTLSTYPYMSISEQEWPNQLDILGGNQRLIVLKTNLEVFVLTTGIKKKQNHWLIKGLKKAGLFHLSDYELNDILGLCFRYLLKLKNELLQDLFISKQLLKLRGHNYVGVHIRTGFVGVQHAGAYEESHPKLTKGKKNWKAALDCAVSMADKHLGNKSLIFLATDSLVVKDMAMKMFGKRFRTFNNYLLHVGIVNINKKPSKQEKEGALYSLVDFFLLAQSYILVRGASGYPWIAGLLCNLPNERLINSGSCKPDDLTSIKY